MEKILVALDGSVRAPEVLKEAAKLARRIGAQLVLYRAVGLPVDLSSVVFGLSPDEVAAMLVKLGQDNLEELKRLVEPELVAESRVSIAIAWQGVCATAHLVHADLIVIGAHGYGGLDRVLGTTAAKIVNHSEVSVFVVKSRPPSP